MTNIAEREQVVPLPFYFPDTSRRAAGVLAQSLSREPIHSHSQMKRRPWQAALLALSGKLKPVPAN